MTATQSAPTSTTSSPAHGIRSPGSASGRLAPSPARARRRDGRCSPCSPPSRSFVDPREVTGLNVWLKPLKFAISTAIYSVTLSWLVGQLAVCAGSRGSAAPSRPSASRSSS